MQRQTTLLEGVASTPKEEFLREPRIHQFAERCFQLAIQCLLDACHTIISERGWANPKHSAEANLKVGEKGVLPMEFARRIVGMATFRNILVHAYLHINREIVHAKLAELSDFSDFARHVLAWARPDGST